MKLTESDLELLKAGNRVRFTALFKKYYPKIAKQIGLDINTYKAIIDFHKEDEMFTVWFPNGNKHFFNTKFEFCGEKEY